MFNKVESVSGVSITNNQQREKQQRNQSKNKKEKNGNFKDELDKAIKKGNNEQSTSMLDYKV